MNSAKFFLLPILTLGISTGFSLNQQQVQRKSVQSQNVRNVQQPQGAISKVSANKVTDDTVLKKVLQMQWKTAQDVESIKKGFSETQQSLQVTNQNVQRIEQEMRKNSERLSALEQGVSTVGVTIRNSFNNEKIQEAAEKISKLMNEVGGILESNQSSGNYVPANYENVNQNSNFEENYNEDSQQKNYDQFNSSTNAGQNVFPTNDQELINSQEFEENGEINNDDDDFSLDAINMYLSRQN